MDSSKVFLYYILTRYLRKEDKLLCDLGIKNHDATQYYEDVSDYDSPYLTYTEKNQLPFEVREKTSKATIYEYKEQNPNGEIIPITLASKDNSLQEFNITYNWAPFCENHFIVFAKNDGNRALKQIYHPQKMPWWMDDLFTQLNCPEYGSFYNDMGAGHSMATLHIQLIKNSFPVFEKLEGIYPLKEASGRLIETANDDWPFKGILARYTPDTKEKVLSDLEERIEDWMSDSNNTFNLLYQMNGEYREFFFVFRGKGYNYIEGISNGIAGYEVAGNIIIEDLDEFKAFPDKIRKVILGETNDF